MARNLARFFVRPVLRRGGHAVGEQIEITDYVLPPAKINVGVDKNEWESGIADIPKMRLSLYNGDERFDDGGGGHSTPVFQSGGRGNSQLSVQWGDAILFDGNIISADTTEDVSQSRINVTVTSPLTNTRIESLVGINRIANGDTVFSTIRKLVELVPNVVLGEIFINHPLRNVPIITNSGAINLLSVWDALRNVLELTGHTMFMARQTVDSPTRFLNIAPSFLAFGGEISIANPLKIKFISGDRRVVNAVGINSAASVDRRSVDEFGERRKNFDFPWIRADVRTRLSSYVVGIASTPRTLLSCTVPQNEDLLSRVRLFQTVRVISEETYATLDDNLAGSAIFGDPILQRRQRGVNFRGRIIRYGIDLEGGTVDLVLESV